MVDVSVATFNVNGLRAILARRGTTAAPFLGSLQADIVCFQETKLTQQDLKQLKALACVPGWTSYFSFCREKSGYAGVATFCRAPAPAAAATQGPPLTAATAAATGGPLQAAAAAHNTSEQLPHGCSSSSGTALIAGNSGGDAGCDLTPLAAMEGLMGICPPQSPAAAAATAAGVEQLLPGPWEELQRRFTWSQALAMDSQGRALVTDHGAFVLFNLYLPATTDPMSPRFQLKLDLLEALRLWCTSLTAAGRHVMVLGDLNICGQPRDHCDFRTAPAAVQARYYHNRSDRAWLQQHMTVEPEASQLATAAGAAVAVDAATGTPPSAAAVGGGSPASHQQTSPAAMPHLVLLDSWRALHPHHSRPFTVWNWRRGVRNDKHASRVDYILLADSTATAGPADGNRDTDEEGSREGHGQQQDPAKLVSSCATAHAPATHHGAAGSGMNINSSQWSLRASLHQALCWRDFSGSDHAPVQVVLRGVPLQLLHPPDWEGQPPSLAAGNLFVPSTGSSRASSACSQPGQRLIDSLFKPVNSSGLQLSKEQEARPATAATGVPGTILEALLNSTAMDELEAAAKQQYRPLLGDAPPPSGGGLRYSDGAEGAGVPQVLHVPLRTGDKKRSAEVAGMDPQLPTPPRNGAGVTRMLAHTLLPPPPQPPPQQQQQQRLAGQGQVVTGTSTLPAAVRDHASLSRGSVSLPPAPEAAEAMTSDSSDEEHMTRAGHQLHKPQEEQQWGRPQETVSAVPRLVQPAQEQQQQQLVPRTHGRRVLAASGVRCYSAAGTVRLPAVLPAAPGAPGQRQGAAAQVSQAWLSGTLNAPRRTT